MYKIGANPHFLVTLFFVKKLYLNLIDLYGSRPLNLSMLRKTLVILLFIVPILSMRATTTVNEKTQPIDLHKIAKVYKATEDITKIITNKNLNFQPYSHLNIGITYQNHWLKFPLKNGSENELDLFLAFEVVINDSLILYKVINDKIIQKTVLGESTPFTLSEIKHQTPVFGINLKANEEAQFFVQAIGNGQPMNLTGKLVNANGFHEWDAQKLFFMGLVYGIMSLILILNFSFYVITKEKIYLIFSAQVLFSILSILYFDGFIYRYILPNNGYWANESIAISLSLTFVFSNIFIANFFNLKVLAPLANRVLRYMTYALFGVIAFSFVHPWGFNFFIIFLAIITTLVAGLLFVSILKMRRLGVSSYFFILLATVSLIIFGSTFQLFMMGFLPDVFFTHYSMHFAVVFQSVFLALAVNDKFRIIREENAQYQVKLNEALNQYSQNLINSIETERQRLAVDIHDGLGQNLLTIRNNILRALKQKDVSVKTKDTFHSLLDITTDTLEDTRAMSYNLRPPILNTMGLTVAIQVLVEKMKESSNLKIDLKMEDSIDKLIHKDLEINVYRILQESFTNVIKHAKASKIDLKIVQRNNVLEINFQDNGIGYDQNSKTIGQGILGIKERVSLLKGTLNISSQKNIGTSIFISIPQNP
jgi:two-component system, sensor histidine kinase LadS